jgi:hypothetical protein
MHRVNIVYAYARCPRPTATSINGYSDTSSILFLVHGHKKLSRCTEAYYNMKQFIIAAAILSATSMSAWAQNNQGQNNNYHGGGNYHGAPGPLMGAGLPGLVVGGVGFGVYWLVRRRRRKTTEV